MVPSVWQPNEKIVVGEYASNMVGTCQHVQYLEQCRVLQNGRHLWAVMVGASGDGIVTSVMHVVQCLGDELHWQRVVQAGGGWIAEMGRWSQGVVKRPGDLGEHGHRVGKQPHSGDTVGGYGGAKIRTSACQSSGLHSGYDPCALSRQSWDIQSRSSHQRRS